MRLVVRSVALCRSAFYFVWAFGVGAVVSSVYILTSHAVIHVQELIFLSSSGTAFGSTIFGISFIFILIEFYPHFCLVGRWYSKFWGFNHFWRSSKWLMILNAMILCLGYWFLYRLLTLAQATDFFMIRFVIFVFTHRWRLTNKIVVDCCRNIV